MEEKKNPTEREELGKELDTDFIHIIIDVPEETVRLEVKATLLDAKGAPYDASMIMEPSDIRKARQDFLDNVELGDDYDAMIVLTDKGREMLENDSMCSDVWKDT